MRETPRARQAWNDYLNMGPDRSLEKLHRYYLQAILHGYGSGQSRGTVGVPTRFLSTLEEWASTHGWQARLAEIAAEEERQIRAMHAQRRRQEFESGAGLDYERVRLLKLMEAAIRKDLGLEEDESSPAFWLKDWKQVGGDAVQIERFNAAEIEHWRGILDDIAKETGGRNRRTALEGTDGGPAQAEVHVYLPDNGRG